MNDKYKDLYHKATELCHVGNAWEWEKHFAELIIKECTKAIEEEAEQWRYPERGMLNISQTIIEEHFGLDKE